MAETHARDAKARLKQMGLSDFCELYGDFVRKKDDSHLNYSDSQISEEFLRRKITIDRLCCTNQPHCTGNLGA